MSAAEKIAWMLLGVGLGVFVAFGFELWRIKG